MPYTPINNDFFKIFLPTQDLTGGEFRVLMLIFWRTTCFNDKYHEAGTDFIVNGTGLSRRQVIRIIKSLSDKGLIKIRTKGIGTHPQIIEVSGDIDGYRWGHRRSTSGDIDGKKMTNHVTQESKVEIKEENKEKEKASPSFFPCETELMKAMPESERQKYIELLPEHLRTKNPDDYSESEWDIYDEWRTSNGLI